jgi:DNA-directed RNA polymerase subunit M/transcription elongation factor TFIIS
MSNFGVILCGKCSSLLVDSGFDTYSSLKCLDCGNEKEFKVGKVDITSNSSVTIEEIIIEAKKEALIID